MAWQPIETAPKRTYVLVAWATKKTWPPEVLQQGDDGVWFNEDDSAFRTPTHWMPLPAWPTETP